MNKEKEGGQKPQGKQQQASDHSITIPVIEEKLRIGKRMVETGRVQIAKRVHEEEVEVDFPLDHEEVDVERVTINQYIETPPPAVRYEGDTMIVPVLKEVVERRLVLVEELHITKRKVQTQTPQKVTLRKEEVTVKRNKKQ